jgi:hypothetical protein
VLARQGLHDAESADSFVNVLTGTGGNRLLGDATLLMVDNEEDNTCRCSTRPSRHENCISEVKAASDSTPLISTLEPAPYKKTDAFTATNCETSARNTVEPDMLLDIDASADSDSIMTELSRYKVTGMSALPLFEVLPVPLEGLALNIALPRLE